MQTFPFMTIIRWKIKWGFLSTFCLSFTYKQQTCFTFPETHTCKLILEKLLSFKRIVTTFIKRREIYKCYIKVLKFRKFKTIYMYNNFHYFHSFCIDTLSFLTKAQIYKKCFWIDKWTWMYFDPCFKSPIISLILENVSSL